MSAGMGMQLALGLSIWFSDNFGLGLFGTLWVNNDEGTSMNLILGMGPNLRF